MILGENTYKVGGNDVAKIYLGSNEVFSAFNYELTGTVDTIASADFDSPDGLSGKDITGNGLNDYLVANETGQVYWFEQTAYQTFTRHTINASSETGKKEGAVWWFVDGGWVAIVLDQTNGHLVMWYPNTGGDYDGTWSRVALRTDRGRPQDAKTWDIDEDGNTELVYSWEGVGAAVGGVHWMKFTGSDFTNPAHYTDYIITTQDGCWWITEERRDLSGNGRATDFAFTARLNGSVDPGVFYLLEPADVTDTWTRVEIDGTYKDILHIEFGNFFGTSNKDLVVNTREGDLWIYDFDNDYAKTVIESGNTNRNTYLAFTHKNTHNGRNKIISSGGPDYASGSFGLITVWLWNGSSWVADQTINNQVKKIDDRSVWEQINAQGDWGIYTLDSLTNEFLLIK